MTSIATTTQLSTFSLLRSIILSNATLASKFNINNILEFEPKHKSTNFCGFPYMVVSVPEINDTEDYLGNQVRHKEFDVEIMLRMDYLAKDNYTTYASALISVMDSATANSAMQASGYHIVKVEAGKPEVINLNQKELVEGIFTIMLEGDVR
jgi:hypothetical protein